MGHSPSISYCTFDNISFKKTQYEIGDSFRFVRCCCCPAGYSQVIGSQNESRWKLQIQVTVNSHKLGDVTSLYNLTENVPCDSHTLFDEHLLICIFETASSLMMAPELLKVESRSKSQSKMPELYPEDNTHLLPMVSDSPSTGSPMRTDTSLPENTCLEPLKKDNTLSVNNVYTLKYSFTPNHFAHQLKLFII